MEDKKEENISEQQKENELTKHELKEVKKTEREQTKEESIKQYKTKKFTKKIITLSIAAVILIGIVFLFYRAITISKDFEPYTSGLVHWHVDFSVRLCGQEVDFSNLGSETHHVGLPLLHTHGDNKIHIEGTVARAEDIAVGKFFEAIGHKFTSNSFDDYTNENDKCSGNNAIKFLVNEQENLEFENYVVKDGDVIQVFYE